MRNVKDASPAEFPETLPHVEVSFRGIIGTGKTFESNTNLSGSLDFSSL